MRQDYFPQYMKKADYTTNATSFADFLAKHNELMKYLSTRVWEYDKELQKRFIEWDKNLEEFDDEVIKLLEQWIDDGTFAYIINHEIFADHMARFAQHAKDIDELEKQLNSENVFIGLDAGKTAKDTHTAGVDSGNYSNTAIGGFAMTSNFRGWKNTAIGHLALADNKGGYYNVAVGDSALEHNIGDNGPTGTDARDTGSRNTGLGSYALRYNKTGTGNVGVGRNAAHANESGNYNTAVGTNAYSGSVQAGNNDEPKSADFNTAMGYNALFYTKTGSENVGIGHHTGYRNIEGHSNVYVGGNAGRDGYSSNRCTGIGFEALKDQNNGHDNVAVGARAAANFQTLNSSVAIGDSALLFDLEGLPLTRGDYVVGIGKQSRVSGDNQIQLGVSTQTTYAYGAVQNRSDERDKADITRTQLGLDFINKIEPIDFRWDYREDYSQEYEVEEEREVFNEETEKMEMTRVKVLKTRTLPKDGSMKGKRKHHGVRAQQVRKVMEEMGVEFGGFQDHSINGGNDVLSIGYEEFISPMINAIQQLSTKLDNALERIETLEKG